MQESARFGGQEEEEEKLPSGAYDLDNVEVEIAGPIGPMLECPTCSRKFNQKAYEKHVKICKKVFVQKRKAFDMKEQRIGELKEELKEVKQSAPPQKRNESKRPAPK